MITMVFACYLRSIFKQVISILKISMSNININPPPFLYMRNISVPKDNEEQDGTIYAFLSIAVQVWNSSG